MSAASERLQSHEQAVLTLVVNVVEAAEQGRDHSVLIRDLNGTEAVAWRVEDAQQLNSALTALGSLRDGKDMT